MTKTKTRMTIMVYETFLVRQLLLTLSSSRLEDQSHGGSDRQQQGA